MAKKVIDLVSKKNILLRTKKNNLPVAPKKILLPGANIAPQSFAEFVRTKVSGATALGLEKEDIEPLVHRYGSDVDKVFRTFCQLKEAERSEGESPSLRALRLGSPPLALQAEIALITYEN